ncbi:putative UPF0481 protein At3g02645 [Cryptomeria japonica]|uniref:putative UPF0481 protein At3g02645 n=1 Tax=Cryptomeria japonica TaxID=3369 RepID=UPI0027DA77EF|nr:putative UPF0481 protein At3g02645 [Cryptomeria japonica]
MANMSVWKTWTIDVIDSLEAVPAVLEKKVLYAVPSCLKNDQTEVFYHPKQISFGPRHFVLSGRSENFSDSENFKSEVARKFPGQFKSLVENLKSNHMERLEKIYGIEVIGRFPEEDRDVGLSWLLARDGCFLLEVLQSFEDGRNEEGTERNQGQEGTGTNHGEKTMLQHILKRDNHHPLLNEIVKDMFKLENQLPLRILDDIRLHLRRDGEANWFESALKNLSPIEVRPEVGRPTYKNKIHILQMLGQYMIDNIEDPSPTTEHTKENPIDEAEDKALLDAWRDAQRNKKKLFKYIINMLKFVFVVIFVLLISPVLIIWFVWLLIWLMRESYRTYLRGRAEEDGRHVPTIEELHRIGLKFKALKGEGISHIHFNESKSTLHLPKFTVDDRSEVILRNLLVMETQWEDKEKIITRYAVFMNDLINTSEDVARLRRRGIIANKLGSDEDVARLWNSVTVPATDIPSYEKIDMVSDSINAYRRKWWRVLWAQFWNAHCSKPWLVASLLGGISLLSLTVVQVVCLFNNCSNSGE